MKKNMHKVVRFLSVVLVLILCPAAWAENDIVIGAGWFDFNHNHNNTSVFSGEWRGSYWTYGLRPVAGVLFNRDGGAYGYGGLNYDLKIIPYIIIIPGFDVGAWHTGNSVDLGGALEFRESLELDYKFSSDVRIGAQIAHMSNADIYRTNPGVNTLMAILSFPLW